MHGTNDTYVALIGDLIASRELEDRAAAQERVVAALGGVNDGWKDELAARFVVTLGDEFQGLLVRADHAFDVVATLERVLGGVRARYGVGVGELATPLQPDAIGMDGPCFHRAREAVERGKRDDRWITVAGFGEARDEVINGLFRLMGGVRRSWTEVQAETVFVARELREQKAAAAARGVSEATVSKALKAALYEPFSEAERTVKALLSGAIDATNRDAGGAERVGGAKSTGGVKSTGGAGSMGGAG